jgi:hypothetical protein
MGEVKRGHADVRVGTIDQLLRFKLKSRKFRRQRGWRMSVTKRLALIAVGYALSLAGGVSAVAVNELRMPADIAQTSPGMVAFGDVILFLLATGLLALLPTWFLLKLFIEKAPRTLLTAELVIAVIGPASWLAVMYLAGRPGSGLPNLPQLVWDLLGPLIAFCAIPRIILGPILLVVEAATFLLARGRAMRALLPVAMLMDIIPLGMFALHMGRVAYH